MTYDTAMSPDNIRLWLYDLDFTNVDHTQLLKDTPEWWHHFERFTEYPPSTAKQLLVNPAVELTPSA